MKQDHEKALKEISENLNQERDDRRILVDQLKEQLQQYANALQLSHDEYSRQIRLIKEENHKLKTENEKAKQ